MNVVEWKPVRTAPYCLVLGDSGQGHAKDRDFSKGRFVFGLNAFDTWALSPLSHRSEILPGKSSLMPTAGLDQPSGDGIVFGPHVWQCGAECGADIGQLLRIFFFFCNDARLLGCSKEYTAFGRAQEWSRCKKQNQ